MNYHLMVDDKFIDGFIEDSEKVSAGKNTYIIEGDRLTAKYVTHALITFVGSLEECLDNLKRQISARDQVFIHWLHYRLTDFILSLPAEIEIGLFFWGGEIVQDPPEIYKKENYEPLSLKYFDNNRQLRPKYLRVAGNPLNILRNLKRKKQYKAQLNEGLKLKYQVLSRLNYFLHWNPLDHDWIKKRVGHFNAVFEYHYYGIGLETDLPLARKLNQKTLVFWLGNSATISNNHLDALMLLSRFNKDEIKIICPLSYGDYDETNYTESVIKLGQEIFGSKFIAITQYMSRTEYYQLFEEVDVVVMYHNRTQAAGNSAAFLQMGKKLFMQESSTVYQLFKKNHANIFVNEDLRKMDFQSLKTPLAAAQIFDNQKILQSVLDTQKKMETLQSLLN